MFNIGIIMVWGAHEAKVSRAHESHNAVLHTHYNIYIYSEWGQEWRMPLARTIRSSSQPLHSRYKKRIWIFLVQVETSEKPCRIDWTKYCLQKTERNVCICTQVLLTWPQDLFVFFSANSHFLKFLDNKPWYQFLFILLDFDSEFPVFPHGFHHLHQLRSH